MKSNLFPAIIIATAIIATSIITKPSPSHEITHSTDTGDVALYKNFEAVLEPGVWHGFSLGPSTDRCAYVAKAVPQEPAKDGSFIEKMVAQPEFNGSQWFDVLRIMIPSDQARLRVKVLVYKITEKGTY